MSAAHEGAHARHFLDLLKVPGPELRGIMDAAAAMKKVRVRGRPPVVRPLAGKTLAMIFAKKGETLTTPGPAVPGPR